MSNLFFDNISFIYYGLNSLYPKECILNIHNNLRVFLGWCQLLGGCGLIIGMIHHSLNPLISITSFLCMMLTAVFTRIKSKDGFLLTFLNAIIFFQSNSEWKI